MKNRVATVLALVLGVAAALASTASAGSTASATAAASASCSAPALGMSAPLTGPAAFLGQEQLSWTQFAACELQQAVRDQVHRQAGRHAAVGVARPHDRAEVRLRREHSRRRRPVDEPGRHLQRASLQESLARSGLRICDARVADQRHDPDVLPGRPERQRSGSGRRELPQGQPEGEDGCGDGLAGRLLEAARRRDPGAPEERPA